MIYPCCIPVEVLPQRQILIPLTGQVRPEIHRKRSSSLTCQDRDSSISDAFKKKQKKTQKRRDPQVDCFMPPQQVVSLSDSNDSSEAIPVSCVCSLKNKTKKNNDLVCASFASRTNFSRILPSFCFQARGDGAAAKAPLLFCSDSALGCRNSEVIVFLS